VFAIGQQQFAIPLCDVREIARNPKITELPCTAAWLRGVTNLRGQILSVTDLRNLLQIDSRRPVVGEKIIVIHNRQPAATTALAVDRVIGIRNVTNEQTDVSDLSPLIASVANGLATVDKSMTVLIDSEQLLGCEELLAYA
jgi:twitching motility protein PilI